MADGGAQEWTPEDYDKEISRLREERDRLKKLLDDPQQQKQRRTRRAQIVGDFATRSVLWKDSQMDGIRKVAAETGEDRLFTDRLLERDGWRHDDDKGNWHTPQS